MICSWSAEAGSALISCTFFNPPVVTNTLLALLSWGKTLANWPTTCLRMLGGASWSRGSSAGRCVHFWRMFFSDRLACEETCVNGITHRSHILLYHWCSQYDKSTLINRSQFYSDLPSMDMIHVTWTDEIINWLSSMQWLDYRIVESYNIATHKEICTQRKIPQPSP